ncbi:MAG TPA: hypothetical protein PLV87_00345, partial [Opitutaceae bacterium]|nr:hypothetical protein [Opitutaceae bacterium]
MRDRIRSPPKKERGLEKASRNPASSLREGHCFRSRTSNDGRPLPMVLHALTVFLGAFLLFQIQPLIGK